jgi:hypothetical protein
MKLPGPKGVITVSGSFKKSLACAKESSQLAEALVSPRRNGNSSIACS